MGNGRESDVIEDEECRRLFAELSEYERMGVRMKIDGHPASPLQIASEYAVKENLSYMRDYVADEEGKVKEVRFVKLSDKNEHAMIPLYAEVTANGVENIKIFNDVQRKSDIM